MNRKVVTIMEDIEIADIRLLCLVVSEKYNHDFNNYAISSFKRRILRVIELFRLGSVSALIEKLRTDPAFFNTFLTEITVNVTEMFRDPSLWRELRDKVFPNLLAAHEQLKIWHAGCSSGEEVYSMSILLHEQGWQDRVKLFATDLDHLVIKKAQEGKYSLKNMLEVNEKNYIRFGGTGKISDYYREENGLAKMNPALVSGVTYRIHDLVKGVVFNKFDLILCRNVLIYFNQNLQNEVFKKFHESLFNYGYFVIGSKETLIWSDIATKFITVNQEEKIFKKVRD